MADKIRMKWGVGEPISIGSIPGFVVAAASEESGEYVLSRGPHFYLFDPMEGLEKIGQAEAVYMIAASLRRSGSCFVAA
jgi:hypothetical protein